MGTVRILARRRPSATSATLSAMSSMTPRRARRSWPAALALVAASLLAGCTAGVGSSASAGPTGAGPTGAAPSAACATTPQPDPATLPDWSAAAQQPSVFPQIINPAGTIACGPTRFMFSFLDAKNVPVAAPDRAVTLKLYDLGADPATPAVTADADFIWAIEDSVGVYVANVDFPTAGLWGAEFVTTPAGGTPESIKVQFDVQPTSSVVGIGDAAPPSDTPTLADVGGDVSRISTDPDPVEAFYTTSVADAVAAKKPFVLIFATPKFCTSAQCGPTLDRVKPIAAAHPEMTFINVEPYELQWTDGQLQPVLTGDPPQLTPVAAANEWRIAAEPWAFVVDGNGTITSSLMLIFSDEELEAAIKAVE